MLMSKEDYDTKEENFVAFSQKQAAIMHFKANNECITIKLTLPHVSAYSLYQRNKNLHFSYIFLVYRNMFTDYDVGKFWRDVVCYDVATSRQQCRRYKYGAKTKNHNATNTTCPSLPLFLQKNLHIL